MGTCFNPRPPHTSAGRLQFLFLLCSLRRFQSAPRTPARGDTHATGTRWAHHRFNPRPAHLHGATLMNECRAELEVRFNPRPAHLHGATRNQVGNNRAVELFQSAPRTPARGDGSVGLRALSVVVFQSAPRTPARGDPLGIPFAPWKRSFNPRPAHLHGATQFYRPGKPDYEVSIRAPHTCTGRHPSFAGEHRESAGFNPRPAHLHGATATLPTGRATRLYYYISANMTSFPSRKRILFSKND